MPGSIRVPTHGRGRALRSRRARVEADVKVRADKIAIQGSALPLFWNRYNAATTAALAYSLTPRLGVWAMPALSITIWTRHEFRGRMLIAHCSLLINCILSFFVRAELRQHP